MTNEQINKLANTSITHKKYRVRKKKKNMLWREFVKSVKKGHQSNKFMYFPKEFCEYEQPEEVYIRQCKEEGLI